MIGFLGFVLECVAVGALVGTILGVIVVGLILPISRLAPWSPSRRADLFTVAGSIPAFAALATMAAAAAPSLRSAFGLAQDHCSSHTHLFHICFLHAPAPRSDLAAFGAIALTVFALRALAFVKTIAISARRARQLERLGTLRPSGRFPIYVVPGSRLCHAAGLWRRRILLSSDIEAQWSPVELEGTVAHEEAHLGRFDPLAGVLIGIAGLFMPPALDVYFRRWQRDAAEDACDQSAAVKVGDGSVVASALLKVAALQSGHRGHGLLGTPAFGAQAFEARVKRLLTVPLTAPSAARWQVFMIAAGLGFLALGVAKAEILHHTAEHVLGLLF